MQELLKHISNYAPLSKEAQVALEKCFEKRCWQKEIIY
jgi:hypothetical protein